MSASGESTFGDWSVEWDRWGIPTASGSTVGAMAFAQGYATGTDRLWQLEWDRRRGDGTSAAVTGQPGHAITDCFFRRVRCVDLSRAGFERIAVDDPQTAELCVAYADGVNAAIGARAGRLSEQFARLGAPPPEPFEAWHVVSIFVVRHLNFATWQSKLWNARAVVALGADAVGRFRSEAPRNEAPVIVPPAVIEALAELDSAAIVTDDVLAALDTLEPLGARINGSNAWAVHGSRTASGKPLIAGDPHRALEAPNVYQQVRLRCDTADVDASGIAFVGVPGIMHFGQNSSVAWAVTNAMADYQDLYVERLGAAVTDERVEYVEVKGREPIRVECLRTANGPVVVGDRSSGVGISLRATGLEEPGASIRSVLPQLRARSVDELDAALSCWLEPVNNFVLADGNGDGGTIAYRTAGRVPIREHTANHWLPVPGWLDGFGWLSAITDADMPRVRNPDVGAIVTANQRVTTEEYPHTIGVDPASGNRAARIWERLEQRTGLTVGDMAELHCDRVNLPGRRFAELAGGALTDWDGSMDAESTQALLFTLAKTSLARRVLASLPDGFARNPFEAWEPPATSEPAVTRVAEALGGWIAADDTTLLPDGATWARWCADAVAEAEEEVGGRTWGDAHHLRPLRLGETARADLGPIDGSQDCVMATCDYAGVTTDAIIGSTARYVWDLAEPTNSGWVVPTGAAEDGDHATDQARLYRAGRLIRLGDGSDA